MPPLLNLPVSLLSVLMTVRPCFTAPAFTTFCGLVAGLAGQVRRRTVVGMLLGACLQRAWQAAGLGHLPRRVVRPGDQAIVLGVPVQAAQRCDQVLGSAAPATGIA